MEGKFRVPNIGAALASRAFPTVTMWNRLEGRPRTDNFDRALRAEVRDPLWMLTRQWQLGEFRADDAGSAVLTRVQAAAAPLTKVRAGQGAAERFDPTVPIEATVERRPVALTSRDRPLSLDLRLLMGRRWLKLVATVGDYRKDYLRAYPVRAPDPTRTGDADRCAHVSVWQAFAGAAGRCMDGGDLYRHLTSSPTHRAWDGVPVAEADKPAIDDRAARFVAWFQTLLTQPITEPSGQSSNDAWTPERLEYRFACAATDERDGRPRDQVLTAEQYFHGHLDWYNFDVDPASPGLGEVPGVPAPVVSEPRSLIAAPIEFDGMPNTRFWAFEDRRTNLGDVRPDTTDLAKLLLLEFGLVYANDWLLVPYRLPVGSLARVTSVIVTNVFGERLLIDAAGSGAQDAWQRWSLFSLTRAAATDGPREPSLLLLPTVPKIQEGAPREEVLFVRDEVANMVWAIEKTVPLPSGASCSGAQAATETLQFHRRLLDENPPVGGPVPPPPPAKAPIRYQAMNTVPEHWIPFVPVHVPDSTRQIQLQRAALPRLLEGDRRSPEKVRPRTTLLRVGQEPLAARPYFVHEEEVPRAGVRLTLSFQRTRGRDGRVLVWLGARKHGGRGEASSGLSFDSLADVAPEE